MNTFKNIFFILCLLSLSQIATAQIEFAIELLDDGQTYQVALVSEESWKPPYNLTSTAQITIRVPTGGFNPVDINNLQSGSTWAINGIYKAPKENREYDYISFGLAEIGTANLNYVANQTLPLFTFKNGGDCTGSVKLMDNERDPFKFPNSKRANVGNQISILGAGGDAYRGILDTKNTNCATDKKVVNQIVKSFEFNAFPNPVSKELTVEINWGQSSSDVEMILIGWDGKQLIQQNITLKTGENQLQLDVSLLPAGVYSLELIAGEKTTFLKKIVKQ